MRTSYQLWTLGAVALISTAMGCDGGGATLKTEPVQGVVTLDGTPVEGATVMFVPVTKGSGLSATGYTDANGVYKLTANTSGEDVAKVEGGTLPGEYHVAVTKAVADVPLSEEEAMEQGVAYKPPAPGQAPQMTYIVPKKYQLAPRSGLKVTVQEGENNIPLELTSN